MYWTCQSLNEEVINRAGRPMLQGLYHVIPRELQTATVRITNTCKTFIIGGYWFGHFLDLKAKYALFLSSTEIF